jgi:nucleoside-diphosphate-sugar epimerase
MIGNGKNTKSMAYVENVALFLKTALTFSPGQHIYNYVDKPDLNMNELVSFTRNILFKKNTVGLRVPSFIGKFLGLLSDLFVHLTGKSLPVSSIRVKKFQETTQFLSSAHKTGFQPSVSLEEGIIKTLTYEFIEDNSGAITFETE